MSQAVQVNLVLGHTACWRKKPTQEGFTHDWTVIVRGEEGCEVRHFVEKVVFYLHESFAKPKRVVKEPPYQVSESGYGSFTLPVEVIFRNKEEPRKVMFEYDLLLPNLDDPPISQMRSECLTFQNPSEEFRVKLIRGGAKSILGDTQKVAKRKPKPEGDEPPLKKKKDEKSRRSSSSSGSGSGSQSESEEGGKPNSPAPKSKTKLAHWDANALKRLHKQLNGVQDTQVLQEIVNIIEQTGIYQLTASTFDFDLCKLDEPTLGKLSKLVE